MSTAEQRASLIDVATGKIRHDDMGGCPDELTGWDSRDPECPACRVLMSSAPDGSDEPYGIVYEWDIGTSVVQRSFSPAPYNGREPDRCVTVYTRPASPQPAGTAPVERPAEWRGPSERWSTGDRVDIELGDGSILRDCIPQADGDLWWSGAGIGERFIDPECAAIERWRITPEELRND
jgi:hypothetical protein